MALLDGDLEFADNQSQVASSAAVTQSTNVHSLGTGLTDGWGTAKIPELGGLHFNVRVGTAVNAVTIITVKLMSHTGAASIASGTEIASIALPAAAPAGTVRSVKLPVGTEIGSATTPHIGATFTVSGAKCTAGNIDCSLDLNPVDQID